MQIQQPLSQKNQILVNSVNQTLPIQDRLADNPITQPVPQNVDQSLRSQLDIEPLLDLNGPSSSSSQPIQQDIIDEDQLLSSFMQMDGKQSQNISQVLLPENELQKDLEKQNQVFEKAEMVKQMKPFFEDFHNQDDFFMDVVPFKDRFEEKIRIFSDRSWYIEGDYIFNLVPKVWEKESICFDSKKIKESIELFLTKDVEGQEKQLESDLTRTRRLHLKLKDKLPFQSNFCLQIYALTELQLVSSYDLPISHLDSDFLIQVHDSQYLSIICNSFYIYIEYISLTNMNVYDDQVILVLEKVNDEICKEHGKILNMQCIKKKGFYLFLEKGFIELSLYKNKKVCPYANEIDKLLITDVYIQAFQTVIMLSKEMIYTFSPYTKQAVKQEGFQLKLLSLNYKSKHICSYKSNKLSILKLTGYNSFEEIDCMTTISQRIQFGAQQHLGFRDIFSDTDDNTIVMCQDSFFQMGPNPDVYIVYNYNDLENQYFLRIPDDFKGSFQIFHSGNQYLQIINQNQEKYLSNETFKSVNYNHTLKRLADHKQSTEISNFKKSVYFQLRQIKHFQFVKDYYELGFQQQCLEGKVHSQLKANKTRKPGYDCQKYILKLNKDFCWKFLCNDSNIEIQKCSLNIDQMLDHLSYVTESSVILNETILDIIPTNAFISETNQYILATDMNLNGVIFDLRSQILIKHTDFSLIYQPLRMQEHQIVLVQLGVNLVMINKYQIQNNTLIKENSFNLTKNLKQFDINNLILPKLMDINDELKKKINSDYKVNIFYMDELKNIVIFRLKFDDIGSLDYIIFDLDKFQFIGSFSVNKMLCQMNYIFFCVDERQVYRNSIVNQLINNFGEVNPHKLHIKIDVVTNKYEFYDLDNQPLHFTQYEFKSFDQIEMNSQDVFEDLDDFTLSKEIQNMSEIEMFNYKKGLYSSFIFSCNDRSELVLEECYKRLLQINPAMSPQICAPHLNNGNILDYSVKNHQYRKINLILNMIMKFNNNLLYNNCIDGYIGFLLLKKVNLREYFESKLAYPKITSLAYPKYSKDSSSIYYPFADQESFTYQSLWNDYAKYLGSNVKEIDDQPLIEVQYNLINIPETMTSKDFINNLIDSQNLEYYETEFIQTVLNFKWDTYANKFFINQFYLYMVFIISYVTDLYFFTINAGAEQEDSRSIVQQLVLKLTCVCYLLLQEYYEFRMLRRIGFLEYVNDFWNIIDQVLTILYFVIVIIDIQEIAYNGIVIMHSCMLILVFIKLCQILRVFQGFSYQVSMLKAVFMDLRYFIMLYVFVLVVYGLIFTLLKIKTSDQSVEYEGINYFGYFIMAFRASTGDFQIDNFYQLEDAHIIFAWIVWISAVLFLNIILLNFIIAVISESYEKVMQKMVAESYRIKAQLIKERESYFNDDDYSNKKYFPHFIIYRRPVEDQIDDNQEWQGFVKDIKKTIYKTHTKSIQAEEQILQHVKTVESTVKTVEATIKDLQTIIKNQDQIIKSHESQNKTLQVTVNEMKVTMESSQNEIKNDIQSILKVLQGKSVNENNKQQQQKQNIERKE
eukprot:403341975